jgi:hypothetical protein
MRVPALGHLPKVAMAARHRQDLTRVEKPGSANQAVFDSTPQTVVAATDIAHGREPAVQGMAEHANGVRGAVRLSRKINLLNVDVGGVGVDVSVDQAGHHRSATDVDDAGFAGIEGSSGDFPDHSVLDQYLPTLCAFLVPAIENAGIFENDRSHETSPSCARQEAGR